jgi:hypothetical protein
LFYADFLEFGVTANMLAAINAGDIRPREVYSGGDQVPNYILKPWDTDGGIAAHMASVSSRTPGTGHPAHCTYWALPSPILGSRHCPSPAVAGSGFARDQQTAIIGRSIILSVRDCSTNSPKLTSI